MQTIVLVVSNKLLVLWDHTNYVCGVVVTVYCREQDSWCFGRKLDSGDAGDLGEATLEHQLHVYKILDYL